MNILIFNWRDIKNPNSGGAEILTHEIAKRWVILGHSVTQFSSNFVGAKKEEIIDGVSFVREGSERIFSGKIPVHIKAMLWYLRHGKGKFDVILDEIHGIPFFTPLYAKERKVVLICEVAGNIWDTLFVFPINLFGKLVERNYFHFYSKTQFLTISDSTKIDLMKKGVREKNITVLPMGLTVPSGLKRYPKEKNPTIIFVGRLSKTKGVRDAILAFKIIIRRLPMSKLWIIGRGDDSYEKELKGIVAEENLTNSVIFYGYISQEKKYELMARAHVLVAPSQKEGWGLIVPEAGLFRTPAIVYNVGGLRDTVKNEVNGIIVSDSQEMGKAIVTVLENATLYAKLQKNALAFARKQNWDQTAQEALTIMNEKK